MTLFSALPEASALPAAVRCLALDTVAATTCTALAERGIDSVLLKGPGLARRLGAGDQRRYCDVDLLVAPTDFDAAQEVLAALGHRAAMADARLDDWAHWHERPWTVPGPVPLTVELHRGFSGVGDPAAFWAVLATSAEEMTLAGAVVRVPDETGAALVVALHAAAPGRSGQPRADLLRALDVLPEGVWRDAAGAAGRCAATTAFALGLRTVPEGAELADRLGLPRQSTPLQWITAHQGSRTAHSLARLGTLPGTRARLRHVALRLVPSPAAMRYAIPLARRGRLGLLLAYLTRVGRHAWQLPYAVTELRAARRSGRG